MCCAAHILYLNMSILTETSLQPAFLPTLPIPCVSGVCYINSPPFSPMCCSAHEQWHGADKRSWIWLPATPLFADAKFSAPSLPLAFWFM